MLTSWRIKMNPPPEVVRRTIAMAEETWDDGPIQAGQTEVADRGSDAALAAVLTNLSLLLTGMDRKEARMNENRDEVRGQVRFQPPAGPQHGEAGTIFNMACATAYCRRGRLTTTGV
jgi:hypothetical protein